MHVTRPTNACKETWSRRPHDESYSKVFGQVLDRRYFEKRFAHALGIRFLQSIGTSQQRWNTKDGKRKKKPWQTRAIYDHFIVGIILLLQILDMVVVNDFGSAHTLTIAESCNKSVRVCKYVCQYAHTHSLTHKRIGTSLTAFKLCGQACIYLVIRPEGHTHTHTNTHK